MGVKYKSLFLHTEVCWLGCGKILRRIYELRQDVMNFICDNKPGTLSNPGINFCFLIMKPGEQNVLANWYFWPTNELNTKVQGRNETPLTTTDESSGFRLKLKLPQTEVARSVYGLFPLINTVSIAGSREPWRTVDF